MFVTKKLLKVEKRLNYNYMSRTNKDIERTIQASGSAGKHIGEQYIPMFEYNNRSTVRTGSLMYTGKTSIPPEKPEYRYQI